MKDSQRILIIVETKEVLPKKILVKFLSNSKILIEYLRLKVVSSYHDSLLKFCYLVFASPF